MANLLPLLLILMLFFVVPLVVSVATAIRVPLNQIDSKGNLTMAELIRRATQRSYNRVAALETKLANTTPFNSHAPVNYGSYEYVMELSIGTPPVPLSAMMDTVISFGHNVNPARVASDNQLAPIFDRTESSTFYELGCGTSQCNDLSKYTATNCAQSSAACQYSYGYLDGSYTKGVLATETFTFGSTNAPVSVPSVAFGCSDDSVVDFQGISGIIGLARGELSLVAFLDTPRFAYCLTTYFDASSSSTLSLGSSAELKEGGEVQTTPLLSNPYRDVSYYYVPLKGISIGETLLPIPPSTFEINQDGSGGLFIDSGTSVTHLVEPAYSTVKQAVFNLITLPTANRMFGALDLCFVLPSSGQLPDLPDMTLHFYGADMRLQKENYMIVVPESGLGCLAMIASSTLSILGNYQQQNMQILYDLESSTLSFEPAQCDEF